MITASPTNTAALLGIDHNGIHWTDLTRNSSFGCERVSPACTNCWAEGVAATRLARIPGDVGDRYRAVTDGAGWNRKVVADPARIPAAFKGLPRTVRGAGGVPRRPRVWPGSMTDLFHKDVPFDFLDLVFREMFKRPHIDFLVLTKRPERMAEYAAERIATWPANVWAGCTVEDQKRADERIPHLLRVPAAVRFLSVEPMLGAVDLRDVRGLGCGHAGCDGQRIDSLTGADQCEHGYWGGARPERISWAIIGSESNGNRPGARKTDPAWILDLVKQCDDAGTAVFVKQAEVDGKLCTLPLVNGRVRAEFPVSRG